MEQASGYREGLFRFGDGGPVVEGITDGTTWNGASNVWVTREDLFRLFPLIEECLDANGIRASLYEVRPGLMALDEDDADRTDHHLLPVVNHDGRTYHGLINGWMWTEETSSVQCRSCEGFGFTTDANGADIPCRSCDGFGSVDRDDI